MLCVCVCVLRMLMHTPVAQGMGMLAGTLLMVMPTEQAFWCLVALLDSRVRCPVG